MPIRIPNNLPAVEVLTHENIFVMDEDRAEQQDIRPLRIAILNLMPTKIVTETQLLRLLGNSPIQVDVVFLHPASHVAKNTSEEHLVNFYQNFEEYRNDKFDGLIITGAPVENMEFEEVNYWQELQEIMDWSLTNVHSTLHICWGAQAGLYHHYGIPKYPLKEKLFGVFSHRVNRKNIMLLRGFDDEFFVPHSRHTGTKREDVDKVEGLEILGESDEAGIYLLKTEGGRQIFVTGHCEYDPLTLQWEYERDLAKGLDIPVPKNYYPENDPKQAPIVKWRSHANLLFSNWLNYHVYQQTPFDLEQLK